MTDIGYADYVPDTGYLDAFIEQGSVDRVFPNVEVLLEWRRSKTIVSSTSHLPLARERFDMTDDDDDVQVWLVERTYSDDEQNLIILTYATTDGERYFRKERALTSFTDVRDTTAAVDVDPDNLGAVDDPDLREQYATEAERMASVHEPDDVI